MEEKRRQSALWLLIHQSIMIHKIALTHCNMYDKQIPHFKIHKVVLEVGTRYLGGRGNFHFRDPPPLLQFPDAAGMLGILKINSAD